MKKGKKPGEFLKQKRSHKQRQHNQDMIKQLRNGDIFQAELFALNQDGMCKVIVEALPLDTSTLSTTGGTIVCLAGSKHKNLHIADIYAKDNGGRCRCNIRNKDLTSVTLNWEDVFGVVLSIEQLKEETINEN